ncbi:biotin/lipoyl-containing protein [Phyllobacterium sp. SB3]|uniref:biotin/lipoyl-containing protein n=1 Tax=Phyllobacterium sp. SB3 TaxID=3156073 RepID=UPI0032AFB60C
MAENVICEIPGNIWKVLVKEGDQVAAGDPLFIMELMKSEVAHVSPRAGKIVAINIVEGQEGVDAGEVAVVLE